MPKRKLENRTLEVILLHTDKHLGEKYEVVRVRPIYAKNILLPQNIAVLANAANLNTYGQKMKAAEETRKKKAQGLDDLFMKLQNDGGITLTKKANKDKTLYAKVHETDIVEAIKSLYGIDIEPHYIKLKKKINEVGSFVVPFLYKTIKKDIIVNVVAEKEVKKEEKEEAKAE